MLSKKLKVCFALEAPLKSDQAKLNCVIHLAFHFHLKADSPTSMQQHQTFEHRGSLICANALSKKNWTRGTLYMRVDDWMGRRCERRF